MEVSNKMIFQEKDSAFACNRNDLSRSIFHSRKLKKKVGLKILSV
jgi:hypothetical protein